LNDESTLDGHSDNLYRVLTLTAQTYTESLLMVTLTIYIGSSP